MTYDSWKTRNVDDEYPTCIWCGSQKNLQERCRPYDGAPLDPKWHGLECAECAADDELLRWEYERKA